VRPTASHPAGLTPDHAALALTLLLGLQALSTDLYLPTLPQIGRGLHAAPGTVQLTMSALILAFGLSQLVWGPVSDRWGRRPALTLGLLCYLAASLGAALAPSIGFLIGMRALQGVGMAAAVVCGRAMVRDLYEPIDGAHVMSKALSGLGLIAVVSPAIGGGLAVLFGWRGSFGFLALTMGAYLWFFRRRVPETSTRLDPHALALRPLLSRWQRILRHPTFWAYAGVSAASYGGIFVFLTTSSYVYIGVLGLSPVACGVAVGTSSACYVAGTWLCRRWLPRYGMVGSVKRGAVFTLVGGLSMAALAWAGLHSVASVMLPQWLYALGHGLHQPCGQAGSVGPFPQEAGTAAALAGFLLAAVSFAIGLGLTQVMDGSVRPMAYGVALWSVVTATVAWTLVQRHGQVRPALTA
jgi:DHA1 family bicyclomycin/chloramphenicol resistance-like MFS transporter